jgi:hypothetical protein
MTDAQVITAITNIADGTPNTASEIRDLFTELFNRSYKTGDVMMLSCSNQYIIDNFDGTGLGIAERVGWAICNGQNTTRNYNGRVPLAYGVDYATMGASGGSKDAVVVEHSHTVDALGDVSNVKVLRFGSNPDVETEFETLTTNTVGVSGTDKNLQPYIVTLFIQKINV